MTYHTLLKSLKNKKYAPVYFLQGEEAYYIDQIVSYLENHVVPPQAKSFDFTTLYGAETTLPQLITQAKRFPMIAPHQVVLIKEAQGLADLQKEATQKYLLRYLEKPNPQTVLLFAYKYKTLDKRKTFTKKVAQQAVLFTAKKVYEKDLPSWIEQNVKERGYQITPEAIHMLITLVGDNLQILSNELDKIVINLTPEESITHPIVRQHVSKSRTYDIFDLQQAIQTHQVDRIWEVTEYFSQNQKKYPLLPQIALLTSFFTKLLLLHNKPHATIAQIASQLRIPAYFAQSYQAALRHYSLAKTKENIQHLHQTDLQIKGIESPTVPDSYLLKTLVAKLI
ncbi:MAG: DNA polymerase III subunit delta [Bacteroidota bacterium]